MLTHACETTCMCSCVCMYACIYVFTRERAYNIKTPHMVCVHTVTNTCMYVYLPGLWHINIYVYIHICIYTYICMYIYKYIYKYMCIYIYRLTYIQYNTIQILRRHASLPPSQNPRGRTRGSCSRQIKLCLCHAPEWVTENRP